MGKEKSRSGRQSPGGEPAKRQALTADSLFQQALESYGRQDWRGAERLCRNTLQEDPTHFSTLHLLGSMLLQSQRFEEARQVLQRGLDIEPRSSAILTKLGIVCTHLKLSGDARRYLDAAIVADPRHIEAYASRGALHESMGNLVAAIEDFRRAIEIHPDFALAHFLLGNNLAASGRPAEAVSHYDRVIELVPTFADALHARGNALREIGRSQDAVASYESALRIDANHLASLSSLADLQIELNDAVAALVHLDRAIALKPDYEQALLLRARLRFERSELESSYADFARLVQINPHLAIAYEGIGNIHYRLHRLPQALANYEEALKLEPERASAHLRKSAALRAMTKLEAALEAAATAMKLSPGQADIYSMVATIQMDLRQLPAATENFRRACELNPGFVNDWSSLLFCLNSRADVSPQEVLCESRRWEDLHALPLYSKQFLHGGARASGGRLRVGYVSSDFRQHAVAAFIEPILRHHDRGAVELFAYYCHPGRDERTEELVAQFDHWIECVTLSDDEMAARIHADHIDILVDLAGHSAGNRLPVFARKPAPIQITYLGYPGTTGMRAMDYRISDPLADPAGSDDCYVETLLRLPHSLWCYQVSSCMPQPSELPALANGYLTLGSFNNFYKIDDRSIQLWARILRETPNARLVMATVPEGRARSELLASFASLGVEGSRVELLPFMALEHFWQALSQVDVSLDPISFNGATTTCESLWMGVPVLSRVGARFLERAGLSILTTAGLPEFACGSDDDCVRLVQALDREPSRLATLRAGLRERLVQTPLFNGALFTRSLEALYHEAWQKYFGAGHLSSHSHRQ